MNRFLSSIGKPPYRGLPWLVLGYILLSVCLLPDGGVFTGHLFGFDDQVRMVQVLQWVNSPHGLIGGWYDRTITRTNAPEGFTTIWSRLVDIPLAAIIMAAQMFVTQKTAALIATAVVPVLETIILFFAAPYFARPLVGKRKARLIVLFLLFTSLFNFTFFSISGFFVGEASHHPWYIILNLLMMGAAARLVMGSASNAPVLMLGGSIALLNAVGIEGLPLIAATAVIVALVAWGFDRPLLARRAAQGFMCGAAAELIMLPLQQPPETLFAASFAEPSILGPILIGAAGLFFAIEQAVLTRAGRRKIASGFVLAVIAALFAAGLVAIFPQMLNGAAAGLSPAERAMALSRHYEAQPVYKLVHGSMLAGLLMPSLLGFAAAALAVATSRGRRRAVRLCYLGFALTGTGMSELFSRYYHHAMTTASVWLLWAWERIKKATAHRSNHYLYATVAFVMLSPFWLLLLPAYMQDAPIIPRVLLFPAALQASFDPCDSLSLADYIDAHYPASTNIDVPSQYSSLFLYQTDIHVDFLANYPSQDKFIDNDYFFGAADSPRTRDIARRHGIDLVAVCRVPRAYIPNAPDAQQPLMLYLQIGRPPSWLKPVPTSGIATDFLLYAVDKKNLGQP